VVALAVAPVVVRAVVLVAAQGVPAAVLVVALILRPRSGRGRRLRLRVPRVTRSRRSTAWPMVPVVVAVPALV
jgi:hypothetical protein